MPNCSFCDSAVLKGTGLLFVKKDGTIFNFCSSKCKKGALGLGREGRRQKWTPAARKFQEMEAVKKTGKKAEVKPAAKPEARAKNA